MIVSLLYLPQMSSYKLLFSVNEVKYSPHCAPSILITFINMVLFKETKVDSVCDATMYAGQLGLQKFLVFIALICVPWMLLAKPIIIMRNQKKQNYSVSHQQIQGVTENGDAEQPIHNNTAVQAHGGGGHGHDEEDIGELFIHQGIHTIEYVLGSVSHTASYLRLWALSLAHARKYLNKYQL